VEKHQDDQRRQPAHRQVDLKAPAPGDLVGEDAADERSHHAGHPKRHAHEAGVDGTLGRRRNEGDDGVRTRADARRPEAAERAPDDERRRSVSDGADETAQLETKTVARKVNLSGK